MDYKLIDKTVLDGLINEAHAHIQERALNDGQQNNINCPQEFTELLPAIIFYVIDNFDSTERDGVLNELSDYVKTEVISSHSSLSLDEIAQLLSLLFKDSWERRELKQ